MQESKLKNKNLLILMIFIATTILILILFLLTFLKPKSFEEVMEIPTIHLNKKRMKMIDNETRFDSGVVLPNKVFQYNATLVNQDSSTLDIDGFKKSATKALLKSVKFRNDFQILRDNKAIISYRFRDKHGNVLFDLNFSPKEYLK